MPQVATAASRHNAADYSLQSSIHNPMRSKDSRRNLGSIISFSNGRCASACPICSRTRKSLILVRPIRGQRASLLDPPMMFQHFNHALTISIVTASSVRFEDRRRHHCHCSDSRKLSYPASRPQPRTSFRLRWRSESNATHWPRDAYRQEFITG